MIFKRVKIGSMFDIEFPRYNDVKFIKTKNIFIQDGMSGFWSNAVCIDEYGPKSWRGKHFWVENNKLVFHVDWGYV